MNKGRPSWIIDVTTCTVLFPKHRIKHSEHGCRQHRFLLSSRFMGHAGLDVLSEEPTLLIFDITVQNLILRNAGVHKTRSTNFLPCRLMIVGHRCGTCCHPAGA